MLNKFLQGLVFGIGFAISAIGIFYLAYLYYFPQPKVMNSEQATISRPPPLDRSEKYLGSTNSVLSGFSHRKASTLSDGPGIIIGMAQTNEGPLSGLELRLALEGNAFTSWVTTDKTGKYEVSVPYGEYRIVGYEIDSKSANNVLPNKIMSPFNGMSTGIFEVSGAVLGEGLSFTFTDPIVLNIQKRKFSITDEIILQWKPHPDAIEYSIQIYEKDRPEEFTGMNEIFEWSARPRVKGTLVNLSDLGVELKPEKYYSVEVDARDTEMRIISKTASKYSGYDFKVVSK